MKQQIAFCAAFLLALGLSGCASKPAPAPGVDPAAGSIDKSITTVKSDVAEFTAASTRRPQPAVESGGQISLDYAGEARVLLKRLATANGLEFKVLGPQPHLPLFVMVTVREAPLTTVLRDIGEQFGERADLILGNSAIEVIYRDR